VSSVQSLNRPSPMSPIIQISLDLPTIDDALKTAEIAVRAGFDWLEAGTPLILGEGLHAVRALHERFPQHPIVADLKTTDAGYLETEMMAKAGAAMTVVMSRAHVGTVKGAVRAARDYGIKVMADVMLEEDKIAAAKRMEELGVDYIIVHLGYDERHEEPWRLEQNLLLRDAEAVAQAVSIPVQAVGGLSIEQAVAMPQLGAPLVVIGAPLAIADQSFKPGADDAALEALLRHIVQRVKGSSPMAIALQHGR